MPENWDAVAMAIDQRLNELGWKQKELILRSHVSPATVREIHRNTANRRRSKRTLAALSSALGWQSDHLESVLHDQPPPGTESAGVAERLDQVERRLDEIVSRLDEMSADLTTVVRHVRPDR